MTGHTRRVIGELTFTAPVTEETAYGVIARHEPREQTMTLVRIKDYLLIEWDAGEDIYEELWVYTVGMDVTEVDGVFEVPEQAIQLLKNCGFNTEEIEERGE